MSRTSAGTGVSRLDMVREAIAVITHRPVRAMLTGLGTILGVFAFVVVLGLTATAGAQISERFTALSSTEVLVEDAGPDPLLFGPSFPTDAQARIQRLPGTVSAGLFWRLPQQTVGAAPDYVAQRRTEDLPILAASSGALATMHPTMLVGRLYDQFHEAQAHRVAVMGFAAAKRLGIARVDGQQAIFINGVPLTVIGIIADVQRRPDDVLLSVILPPATATAVVGTPAAQTIRMLVETRVGAAKQVSTQVALVLRPDRPEVFRVIGPPDPTALREGVSGDLRVLLLALTAVGLVIGAVGIMNTTMVAVLERVPEIGLRRALGARPRDIALQVLVECGLVGTMSGLIGGSLGVVVIVGVAVVNDWTAVVEPAVVVAAPLVGAFTGILAGLYPALRAAKVHPIGALRRS